MIHKCFIHSLKILNSQLEFVPIAVSKQAVGLINSINGQKSRILRLYIFMLVYFGVDSGYLPITIPSKLEIKPQI